MSPLQLAWLNLLRRKLSTFIALTAIAVSVACGGVLLRLYILSESRFSSLAKAGDAIIGAKAGGVDILLGALNLEGDYPHYLPKVLFQSLRNKQSVHFEDGASASPEAIQSVIPFLYFAKYKSARVIATDESFLQRPRAEDSLILTQGSWCQNANEVVVGARLAEKDGLHLGDTIQVTPWTLKAWPDGQELPRLPMKIVGILPLLRTAWDHAVFASLTTGQNVLNAVGINEQNSIWSSNVLNYFLLYTLPSGRAALESLINQRTVGQVVWIDDEVRHLKELTSQGETLGLTLMLMVLFLGGLAVAGMMVTRFEAMGTQMAVVRAIGYRKREVAAWLFWEGLILGTGAVVCGAILDLVAFPLLRWSLGSAIPMTEWIEVPIWQSYPVWLVALLATTMAVALPLIRISRQDTHLLLKGV
jgi:putative ABC transport system permease protein